MPGYRHHLPPHPAYHQVLHSAKIHILSRRMYKRTKKVAYKNYGINPSPNSVDLPKFPSLPWSSLFVFCFFQLSKIIFCPRNSFGGIYLHCVFSLQVDSFLLKSFLSDYKGYLDSWPFDVKASWYYRNGTHKHIWRVISIIQPVFEGHSLYDDASNLYR